VPKRVFISYRREDTGPAAGRVFDRLARVLPRANVFFDVSSIGGGEDFKRKIEAEIARSDAAVIFIGAKWLEPTEQTGQPRIWQSDDYVRAEVRAALSRATLDGAMLVLPVLVSDAGMPKADQLPDDIRAMTTRNALRLRHEHFDDDAESIVAAIVGARQRTRVWEDRWMWWSRPIWGGIGAVAAGGLMVAAALVHFWLLARPISASIGGSVPTVLMLIAGLIAGVWGGLRYEARRRRR
jgi:hypothetical protein